MIFTPRPYQRLMRDHMQTHERCNVFASPGMGKSVSVLAALDSLSLCDQVFPALVIGPMRVANTVWTGEVEKWAFAHGLRVVKILGTANERLRALRTPADIYTIHYGLLNWLMGVLGDKWPFTTVVSDECFAAGTPVSTPDGDRAIETLVEGDLVCTPIGPRSIVRTMKKQASDLVRLTLTNGVQIDVTANHPFFTANGWRSASETAGQSLVGYSGVRSLQEGVPAISELQDQASILFALLQRARSFRSEPGDFPGVARVDDLSDKQSRSVYDLEVEGAHTYFAGGVLVHNCTRLKNVRCSYRKHPKTEKLSFYSGGAVNASALAKNVHKATRWINLTGTPAPNGLKDLWGQQWFIDYGKSLGNTFDAFSRRWFYQRKGTSNESAVLMPFDHAEKEIIERIKPVTISLNAYDWFDCERPREVNIEVELSESVMKQYRKLHKETVLKLSEQTIITAVNAGAITNKCLQLASGHVFDTNGVPHFVHHEKLDALESLVENLAGAPLLVAYHFTPDRDAILKRFPFAKLLPSGAKQQEVEDDWNAGKIQMLLVHPASAGHGLNLQYGGCDVAIFSPQWDLELYEQIIERIGPVRQMQAGLDRIVSVYNLIAKHTFDQVVVDRRSSKASIQQAVMQAVKAGV